jgi:hypothetical protein
MLSAIRVTCLGRGSRHSKRDHPDRLLKIAGGNRRERITLISGWRLIGAAEDVEAMPLPRMRRSSHKAVWTVTAQKPFIAH